MKVAIILGKSLERYQFRNGETLFSDRKNIIAESSLTQWLILKIARYEKCR